MKRKDKNLSLRRIKHGEMNTHLGLLKKLLATTSDTHLTLIYRTDAQTGR